MGSSGRGGTVASRGLMRPSALWGRSDLSSSRSAHSREPEDSSGNSTGGWPAGQPWAELSPWPAAVVVVWLLRLASGRVGSCDCCVNSVGLPSGDRRESSSMRSLAMALADDPEEADADEVGLVVLGEHPEDVGRSGSPPSGSARGSRERHGREGLGRPLGPDGFPPGHVPRAIWSSPNRGSSLSARTAIAVRWSSSTGFRRRRTSSTSASTLIDPSTRSMDRR